MLYTVGVILQRERMPDTSAIQAWFDVNRLPCTIDDVDFSMPSAVISGSVLGQRVFADVTIERYEDGQGQFELVFPEYFEGGDCVISVLATASLIQRSFSFLVATSIASLSGGRLVGEDQPKPEDPSEFIRMCREFIVRARLLIAMLSRQGQRLPVRLDAESIAPMDGESRTDRERAIATLSDGRHIQPGPQSVSGCEQAAYRLSDSGFELASSMYWPDSSEKVRKRWGPDSYG